MIEKLGYLISLNRSAAPLAKEPLLKIKNCPPPPRAGRRPDGCWRVAASTHAQARAYSPACARVQVRTRMRACGRGRLRAGMGTHARRQERSGGSPLRAVQCPTAQIQLADHSHELFAQWLKDELLRAADHPPGLFSAQPPRLHERNGGSPLRAVQCPEPLGAVRGAEGCDVGVQPRKRAH